MHFRFLAALSMISGLLFTASAAQAQPISAEPDQNIFVMGGPFSSGHFSDVLLPWQAQYESNMFVGLGYQRFFHEYGSFRLGAEAGIGLRLGSPSSGELWGGLVARLTTFSFGDINVTPAVTAGLSLVTDTIGVEAARADAAGESANVLFYLAPEIAVSSSRNPRWEAFGRLQHRSGGFGTLGNIDGSNAVVAGVRFKF